MEEGKAVRRRETTSRAQAVAGKGEAWLRDSQACLRKARKLSQPCTYHRSTPES